MASSGMCGLSSIPLEAHLKYQCRRGGAGLAKAGGVSARRRRRLAEGYDIFVEPELRVELVEDEAGPGGAAAERAEDAGPQVAGLFGLLGAGALVAGGAVVQVEGGRGQRVEGAQRHVAVERVEGGAGGGEEAGQG